MRYYADMTYLYSPVFQQYHPKPAPNTLCLCRVDSSCRTEPECEHTMWSNWYPNHPFYLCSPSCLMFNVQFNYEVSVFFLFHTVFYLLVHRAVFFVSTTTAPTVLKYIQNFHTIFTLLHRALATNWLVFVTLNLKTHKLFLIQSFNILS